MGYHIKELFYSRDMAHSIGLLSAGGATIQAPVAWLGISYPQLGCFLLFWAMQARNPRLLTPSCILMMPSTVCSRAYLCSTLGASYHGADHPFPVVKFKVIRQDVLSVFASSLEMKRHPGWSPHQLTCSSNPARFHVSHTLKGAMLLNHASSAFVRVLKHLQICFTMCRTY